MSKIKLPKEDKGRKWPKSQDKTFYQHHHHLGFYLLDRPDISGAQMCQRAHYASPALRFFWSEPPPFQFWVSVHSISSPHHYSRSPSCCPSVTTAGWPEKTGPPHGVGSKLMEGLTVSEIKPASSLLVLKLFSDARE